VQPHRHGLREIRISHDDRHGAAADRITETTKRVRARLEAGLGLAGDLQRMCVIAAEAEHGVGTHHDQRRLNQRACRRVDLRNQQRRQSLRDLRELDRGAGRLACRTIELNIFVRIRVGDERIDCVRIRILESFSATGPADSIAERSRAPCRDHKP